MYICIVDSIVAVNTITGILLFISIKSKQFIFIECHVLNCVWHIMVMINELYYIQYYSTFSVGGRLKQQIIWVGLTCVSVGFICEKKTNF